MADEKLVTREERVQEEQRRAAREVEQSRSGRKLDETEPGGKYKVGDQMVDAEGQPVKKGGKD